MPHLHSHATPASGSDSATGMGKLITWPKRYDLLVNLALAGRGERVRRAIADALDLQPGDQVLDVGCGTGTLSFSLAQRVAPDGIVVGVDAAPEMIEAAAAKPNPTAVDVDFLVAPAQHLPFPDDHFNAAVSSLMIHHLPPKDRIDALREIRRVVTPGGRLVIAEFQPPRAAVMRRLTTHLLGHAMATNNLADIGELAAEAGWHDPQYESSPVSWLGLIVGERQLL